MYIIAIVFEHLGSKEWTPNTLTAFGLSHVTTGKVVGENNDRLSSRYQVRVICNNQEAALWNVVGSGGCVRLMFQVGSLNAGQ